MAFTLVDTSSKVGTTDPNPFSPFNASGGTATQAGDLMVMVLAETQNNVADVTLPAGYTSRVAQDDGTGCLIIADKLAAVAGEDIVLGGRNLVGNYDLCGFAFRGSAASGYFDKETHTDYGSVSAATPGSLTPDNASEVLVAAAKHTSASGGEAADSSFTVVEAATLTRLVVAYKIKTTGAAENPSLSWTTASDAFAAMVAYSTTAIGGGTGQPTARRFDNVPHARLGRGGPVRIGG